MRLQILSIIAAALTASCAAAPYNVTDILEIVNSLRAQIHTTDKLATQIVTPDGGDNKVRCLSYVLYGSKKEEKEAEGE